MTDYDLLKKTELVIEKINLNQANLTDIAVQAAQALGLKQNDVLVVDYRDETLTLDILDACVNANQIVGKKELLLQNLGRVSGVTVSSETAIRSNGMLGWIDLDRDSAQEALRQAEKMAADILDNVSKRVIVFSTGGEVAAGQVQDTNTPAIREGLTARGYRVTAGPTLKDDMVLIAAKLREAADYGGYGLIITTGGVGAEDKDQTVEAVKTLDPEAATPYICRYEIGTGRHVKDGVRIAVGRYMGSLIVALPGPNDEVKAGLTVLAQGLADKQDKHVLAENIAGALREILRKKMNGRHLH